MTFISVPSRINTRRLNTNPKVVVNGTVTVFCLATGVPTPNITWYKDGAKIDLEQLANIDIKNNGRELTISEAKVHSMVIARAFISLYLLFMLCLYQLKIQTKRRLFYTKLIKFTDKCVF